MVLIAAGVLLLSSAAARAAGAAGATVDTQGQGCKECHESVYKVAQEALYKHTVVQDKCEACHILQSSNIMGEGSKGFKSSDLNREVLLYLKGLPGMTDAGTSYLVEVKASDRYGRGSLKKKFNFKPTEVKAPLLEPSVVPAFVRVGVDNISVGGVFPEATISWTTNFYAATTLEYGTSLSYGNKVTTGSSGVAYYKEHVARLPELKRNKTYHFRITARDVTGRIFKSEDRSFTTRKNVKHKEVTLRPLSGNSNPVIEGIKVLSSADGIVGVVVTTSKPVRVALKAREDKETDSAAEVARHGKGFLSPKASRVDVCVGCHNQGISHPVGITANTRTTKVPEGLPTLPGGIITCNTCHTPHGGNLKFFARIDFDDATMCAQCHTTEPFI